MFKVKLLFCYYCGGRFPPGRQAAGFAFSMSRKTDRACCPPFEPAQKLRRAGRRASFHQA
ncbi:hypothetical protein DPQ22_03530 [Candidatus Tokpelaia sp.]|nr:hypothetical protein DPQ22_03530 [Candidatus Tokpelaia sp.]